MTETVYDFDAIHKRLRELGGGLEVIPDQADAVKEMCMHGSPLEECVACCSPDRYRGP
jgi:hypothetical protein